MKKLICFFTFTLIALIANLPKGFSQQHASTAPILGIQAEFKPYNNNDSANIFYCKVTVTLIDTSNIGSVVAHLGSSKGSSDIVNRNFSFSQTGTFSDGTSFNKNGKKLTLILGNSFQRMEHFFGEIYCIRSDGSTTTTPVTFSR